MFGFGTPKTLPSAADALAGREIGMPVPATHVVTGASMKGPWPGMEVAYFGLGCFWGAERKFWQTEGVVCTAAGYQGGHTPNPTYKEVCSGGTGHTEAVQVVFDPRVISYPQLLKVFWENHDPTQGMRQGNDRGTQYRSAVYTTSDAQLAAARASATAYGEKLEAAGLGPVTTEIGEAGTFFYAEEYHQQYLEKNPQGYCGIGGTGVSCPIGLPLAAEGPDDL